ncbi:MAG: hypothetical protein ACI81R_002509 [Bradymonadia bacterium]|jgi:hypothetical protein
MNAVNFERRKVRSVNPNRAISYLFRSIARDADVGHMALADKRGLLLVHAGEEETCDVLAAYAPLLSQTVDPESRDTLLGTMTSYLSEASPEKISVRRFEYAGEALFLCALGKIGAGKDVAVCRAISGARRILA